MSSAKARSLRERMSIDPDAPEPAGGTRRARPTAPVDDAVAPPVPRESPAAPQKPPVPAPSAPSGSGAARRAPTRSNRRRTRDDLGWSTALDDPAVSGGGNGYRSFYVSDEVFARFRAAIYWTARRPDVTDVPDNMSVGVEDYMDQVASDLERRFNGCAVFPPTPDQLRSHRRREGGRG